MEKERDAASLNKVYSIEDYVREIDTYTSSDNKNDDNSFVLSTIHASKGLQFQYVFLCGCEDGLFPMPFKNPHGNIKNEQDQLFEERRLCFVAVTRASIGLYVSCALSKSEAEPNSVLYPSRFFYEMQGIEKAV